MWLEDEEINHRLQSNCPAAITEAIEAILFRWQGGDNVVIKPLRAELLKPFEGKVPTEVLNPFLDFLLGVDGVSALELPEAYKELAKAIVFYIDTSEQYAVALRLKVDREPATATREVVTRLDNCLVDVGEDRIPHIEFFLSCLLDGKPEVRAATVDALAHWSATHTGETIIHALFNELTEDEQKLLESRIRQNHN